MKTLDCADCGITKEEFARKNPPTFNDRFRHSFYIYSETKHLCGKCHKEAELKQLFDLMDAREKRQNEQAS